jgi:hypothetical protein
MATTIECPFCKQPIEFPEEMSGQWTDCPSCREQIPLEKTPEITESKASLAGLYQGVRNRNATETSKVELSKDLQKLVQVGFLLSFLFPIVGFFFGLFLLFRNAVAQGVACMILSLLFSYLWFELLIAIF